MPRIAEARTPALPVTTLQQERCERALVAAARLGAQYGLERVQMQQVAAEAGVAIGTLYRYFPSKYHLFAAVLDRNVATLQPVTLAAAPSDRGEAIATLMANACRSMLRHPLLARAMINSVNALRSEPGTRSEPVTGETTMHDRILAAAGVAAPTADDERRARLVEQAAYGILTWAIAGELSVEEAVTDLRTACALLCAEWDD